MSGTVAGYAAWLDQVKAELEKATADREAPPVSSVPRSPWAQLADADQPDREWAAELASRAAERADGST